MSSEKKKPLISCSRERERERKKGRKKTFQLIFFSSDIVVGRKKQNNHHHHAMLIHFILTMQQHAKVSLNDIDDDDDDDDEDVKQEVTQTIEKFVHNRHVQTLKYLRHVIDENRHLRLHIEHLKRRQNDPVQSPAVVDPFDPEESPVNEIRVAQTPEVTIRSRLSFIIHCL